MKFFALETDIGKLKERFCSEDECEVHMTYYHALSFLFAVFREIVITIILFGVGIFAWIMGWPMMWVVAILAALWFLFVFFNLLKAYIDWRYDFILVTSDKVILVDQTSFLRHEIKPIHLENIGSVTTRTQYWNIFNFGIVKINLKEGEGGDIITLKYVPEAEDVAAKIADVTTTFQRQGRL
jgi:hypothetical protein